MGFANIDLMVDSSSRSLSFFVGMSSVLLCFSG